MPDPLRTHSDSHLVVGLSEVVVNCTSCGASWKQPIDPRERLSYLVCPYCNFSAPTTIAYDLIDRYEPRASADA